MVEEEKSLVELKDKPKASLINNNTDGNKTLKRPRSDDEEDNKLENEVKDKDSTTVKDVASTKSQLETKKIKLNNEDEEEKPKFVFGSTTKFGAGFNLTEQKKDSEIDASPNKPMTFGSGFSFGSGFGVLKKTTEEDKDNETKIEDETKEDSQNIDKKENTEDSKNEVITENGEKIQLRKQDVKSGEELEETIYQANAKLYQLIDFKTGWKERGVGVAKLNKDRKSEKARIIMRTRTVLKVILNLSLVKGITVQKGFPGSLQSEKFLRIIGIDENNRPVTFALKTGKEETTEELYKQIDSLISK